MGVWDITMTWVLRLHDHGWIGFNDPVAPLGISLHYYIQDGHVH